jgi:hypothetical protein
MRPKVTDIEQLRKKVRQMAAGRVLSGDRADVGLPLATLGDCQVRMSAGYGSLSQMPKPAVRDRLMWVLDGFVEVHAADGSVTNVSQGESTVLLGGTPYRLVFPQLTIYVTVTSGEKA